MDNRLTVKAALLVALLILPAAAHAQRLPADVGPMLAEVQTLMDEALAASRQAAEASDVAAVKRHVEAVNVHLYGLASGLADPSTRGAAAVHTWKTEWQTDGSVADSSWEARYGTLPPPINDVRELGVIGRARHVREALAAIAADSTAASADRETAAALAASLSNVVGWMHLTIGYKGSEEQPRISLTHMWDMPKAFWQGTADTGWLHEAHAQAFNILKTDYEGDVAEARAHAADLTMLLERSVSGLDADGDGQIAPAPMEGGLDAAFAVARGAGVLE